MDRWSSGHQAVDPACSHVRMEGSPRIGTVIDSGHMDPPATPTEQYFVVAIRFAPRYRPSVRHDHQSDHQCEGGDSQFWESPETYGGLQVLGVCMVSPMDVVVKVLIDSLIRGCNGNFDLWPYPWI